MRIRVTTVTLLMLSLLILTACGGVNRDDPSLPEPLIIPEANETYTTGTLIETGTLTLDFPEGWYREEQNGQLLIANMPLDELEEDDAALFVSVLPIDPDVLPEDMDINTEALMNAASLTIVMDVLDSGTLTLNEQTVAYTTGIYENNEVLVLSLQLDTRLFVVVTAVSVLPINGDVRRTVEDITGSIRYTTN